jgi:hypothetical protein
MKELLETKTVETRAATGPIWNSCVPHKSTNMDEPNEKRKECNFPNMKELL